MGSRKSVHILVVPATLQSHINPMFQFSKRLASKGLRITLVIVTKKHSEPMPSQLTNSPIAARSTSSMFPDGVDEGYFKCFEIEIPKNLSKLIENLSHSDYPVSTIVYDSLMPCVLEVAHNLGLKGASFFSLLLFVLSIDICMKGAIPTIFNGKL